VEILDFLKVSLYVVLATAFLPCVLYLSNSKKLISWKQSQVHRPFALFLFGVFILVNGLFCVYFAISALHSGTVDCPLKMCGTSYSLEQPFAYWTSIAAWYGCGVTTTGMAVAVFRNAFRSH
jgi:hypothetical protein